MNTFTLQTAVRLGLVFAAALSPATARAAGFVYEGRLDDAGTPANGRYDLRLSPFADAKSSAALGAPIVFEDVPVVDGRFRVDFDLPLSMATSAWIEVGVRDGSAVGAFSTIPGRSEAASAKAIGACWSSTGDSATNPAVNFLGTTDAQPLVLRVQNQQVVRYEPSAFLFGGQPATANVIAGARLNGLFAGVRGAVIAGGGLPVDSDPALFDEGPNQVNDDFGTVGGGYANVAGDQFISTLSAQSATVSGGARNAATAAYATVGGGNFNRAVGDSATVAGGEENLASGGTAAIGGGTGNTASGELAAISGGRVNAATARSATVAGGEENTASAPYSVVTGGVLNVATAQSAVVAGGDRNRGVGEESSIGGGANNVTGGRRSVVSGGTQNCAGGENSWAGGNRAKVRVALGQSFPNGSACFISNSGDLNGDDGTFVWNGGFDNFESTGSRQFLVNSPNGVAINVNDPGGSTLRVAGTVRVDTLGTSASTTLCRNASNQISGCSSSARYKEHITDLDLGLAVVERLRPVAYEWKSTHEADVGFVAEEIAQIDPRLVTRNAAGEIEGVKYERLTAVLAGAVQELAQAMARREAADAALRERQAALEAQVAALVAAQAGRDGAAVAR